MSRNLNRPTYNSDPSSRVSRALRPFSLESPNEFDQTTLDTLIAGHTVLDPDLPMELQRLYRRAKQMRHRKEGRPGYLYGLAPLPAHADPLGIVWPERSFTVQDGLVDSPAPAVGVQSTGHPPRPRPAHHASIEALQRTVVQPSQLVALPPAVSRFPTIEEVSPAPAPPLDGVSRADAARFVTLEKLCGVDGGTSNDFSATAFMDFISNNALDDWLARPSSAVNSTLDASLTSLGTAMESSGSSHSSHSQGSFLRVCAARLEALDKLCGINLKDDEVSTVVSSAAASTPSIPSSGESSRISDSRVAAARLDAWSKLCGVPISTSAPLDGSFVGTSSSLIVDSTLDSVASRPSFPTTLGTSGSLHNAGGKGTWSSYLEFCLAGASPLQPVDPVSLPDAAERISPAGYSADDENSPTVTAFSKANRKPRRKLGQPRALMTDMSLVKTPEIEEPLPTWSWADRLREGPPVTKEALQRLARSRNRDIADTDLGRRDIELPRQSPRELGDGSLRKRGLWVRIKDAFMIKALQKKLHERRLNKRLEALGLEAL